MGLRSTRWSVLAIVGALALGVAACGGDDGDSPSSGAAGAEADAKPLKIGASLPLTGDFSEPGKAAKQGYEVWQAMINEKGGLLGRKVELVIKDDASNQNTVVSDYNALISGDKVDLLLGTFSSLLNLPASAVAERAQMLYVEPAGGNPDIFKRGFKTIFFAQQATAAHQGDVWAKWIAALPEDKRPEDGRLPDARRPVHDADLGGHRGDPQGRRHRDRLPQDLHRGHEELRLDRQRGQGQEPGPRGRRHAVRGRRRLPARARQGRLHAEVALPDQRAVVRRPVRRGRRRREHRGRLLRGQPQPGVRDARQPGVRRQVPGDVRRARPCPRTRPTRTRRRRSCRPRSRPTRPSRRPTSSSWPTGCAPTRVPTVLGELSWNEDGSPKGEFLVGQWQNGKPEIVLPPDAATIATRSSRATSRRRGDARRWRDPVRPDPRSSASSSGASTRCWRRD